MKARILILLGIGLFIGSGCGTIPSTRQQNSGELDTETAVSTKQSAPVTESKAEPTNTTQPAPTPEPVSETEMVTGKPILTEDNRSARLAQNELSPIFGKLAPRFQLAQAL